MLLTPISRLLVLIGNALTPGRGFRNGPFASEIELREVVDLAQQRGPLGRLQTLESRHAGPVCLYVPFRPRFRGGSTLSKGVARRSFGLVRLDLLLQIGPSVPDRRACYVSRR